MSESIAAREQLSKRELQIAEAYASGQTYKAIAGALGVAPATVRTHLGTIYRKLEVSTKIELLNVLRGDAEPSTPAEEALPEALLENIAMRFGHDNPDAGLPELTKFLKEKAIEWRAFKARMTEIADSEARVQELLSAAEAEIDSGHFERADELLEEAEAAHLAEHTLKPVRRQAELRATRGDAALLKGDEMAAYDHFSTAAAMLLPFDQTEGCKLRRALSKRLYDHGFNLGGRGLELSACLVQINLETLNATDHLEEWLASQNDLANYLTRQATRKSGEQAVELFGRASKVYEQITEMRDRQEHPIEWAKSQCNLATVLIEQGQRVDAGNGIKLIERAVATFEAARDALTMDQNPLLWTMINSNLSTTLIALGSRMEGEVAEVLYTRAITASEAAVEASEQLDNPSTVAQVQMNLGNVCLKRASDLELDKALRYLMRARSAYEAALGFWTEDGYPVQWAMTQSNLARALAEEGEKTDGEAGNKLLKQALAAHRAALRVRTEEAHPAEWALTRQSMGHIHMSLADRWGKVGEKRAEERGVKEATAAITAFDDALRVLDPVHMAYRHKSCTDARDEAVRYLEQFGPVVS